MIWNLLNADCVAFFSQLADLRNFETHTSNDADTHNFSIFKMCDNDTNKLIITLAKLSKDRIYKVIPRVSPCYSEDQKSDELESSGSGTKHKKTTGMQRGSLIEKQYGHLYNNSFHLNKWLQFADKCCQK